MKTCPGHIGRGTGDTCCACGLPIPINLRRTADSPQESKPGCPKCVHPALPHEHI